jgi:hypothetical protein
MQTWGGVRVPDRGLIPVCSLILVVVTTLLPGVSVIAGATPEAAPAQQQMDSPDFSSLVGTTLAEGRNEQPVGFLALKSYRLEEVVLPQPLRATVNGRDLTVNRVMRLTVTGGPFEVRDMPATIWVDNTAVGFGQENVDLSEISTIIYDASVLRDGALVAVSYQANLDRTELPERLTGLHRP